MISRTSLTTAENNFKDKIYTIRNLQVMLDEDLAFLYNVPTKRLNEQVKRNLSRFPDEFCFQITKNEYKNLRSQFATSKKHGGRRNPPYAFTEQGVAMLSAVLKSETAIRVSIKIMQAFVEMRKHLISYGQLFQKIDHVEKKQLKFEIDTDQKFDQVFNALSANEIIPNKKLFFEGEIFDAHLFVSEIIRSAKTEIVLVDNFIDDTVLTMFAKRKSNVKAIIYCRKITREILLDVKKFNSQYSPIEIKELKLSHDRFLIIDRQDFYHFGASLKDLGKKWFACSKFDNQALTLLKRLKK